MCSCPDGASAWPKPRLSQAFASTNRLLSALSDDERVLLVPHLEAVPLPLHQTLEQAKKRVPYVYFMEQGFASVVANGRGSREVEVGIIGREGMTGAQRRPWRRLSDEPDLHAGRGPWSAH